MNRIILSIFFTAISSLGLQAQNMLNTSESFELPIGLLDNMNNSGAIATFTLPTNETCLGDIIELCNATLGATHQWRLNGINIPTATDSCYSASATGTYDLIVTDKGGNTSLSSGVLLNFTAPPMPTFSVSAISACEGDSILLDASGYNAITYEWFLNAFPITTGTRIYAKAIGIYTLVVSDAGGCFGTSASFIPSFQSPPIPTIQAPSASPCSQNIKLSGGVYSNHNYQWIFNGANIVGANDSIYQASASGTYELSLSDALGCSSKSAPELIMLSPIGTVSIAAPITSSCGLPILLTANSSAGAILSWYRGGQVIPGIGSSTYSANSSAVYHVESSLAGCISTSSSVQLDIYSLPTASLNSASTSACSGDSILLDASTSSGGQDFIWRRNGVSIVSGQNISSFEAKTSGMFDVILSNSFGCSDTSSSINLIFTPNPTISLAAPLSSSCGVSLTINASVSVGAVVSWFRNGALINGQSASSLIANNSGLYHSVASANGCTTRSNDVRIDIYNNPGGLIFFSKFNTCQGDSILLYANFKPGYSYQWRMNQAKISGATDTIYYAKSTATYDLEFTNSQGCIAYSSVVPITVFPLPTVSISSPITSSCASNIVLSSTGTSGSIIQWFDGTGAISGATGSTYSASKSGTYFAEATLNGCKSNSNSIILNIHTLPPNTINASKTILCKGEVSVLDAPIGTGFSYAWFKDGNPIGTAVGPILTVSQAGVYNFEIRDANFCFSASSGINIQVVTQPFVQITSSANNFCPGDSLRMIATSDPNYAYEWFYNSALVSSATDSVFYANAVGTYECEVTLGSCSGRSAIFITGMFSPPVSTISAVPGSSICSGDTATLSVPAISSWSYQWFRDRAVLNGEIANNLLAGQTGIYEVFIVDLNGCSNFSSQLNFQVQTLPIANVTASANAICSGDSLGLTTPPLVGASYQWYNGGNLISGAIGNIYFAKNTGNYTVLVSAANGCDNLSNNFNLIVQQSPKPVFSSSSNLLCQGDSIVLTAGNASGFDIRWLLNGLPILGETMQILRAGAIGSYQLELSFSGNCPSISSAFLPTLTIAPSASIMAGGLTTFCKGDSLILKAPANALFNYQWFKDGNIIQGANDSSIWVSLSGKYQVEIWEHSICRSLSQTTTIFTVPVPSPLILSNGNTYCSGDSLELLAKGINGLSYSWLLNNSVIPGANDSIFYATTAGNYKVIILNPLNCGDTSALLSVSQVSSPPASISSSNLTMCLGDSILMSANLGTSLNYQWNQNGVPILGATNSTLYATKAGNYSCSVYENSNCSNMSNVLNIKVHIPPLASIRPSGPTSFCSGDSVVLSTILGSNLTYVWYFNGSPISGSNSSSITAKLSGDFSVQVTDTFNCGSTSGIETITVNPIPAKPIIQQKLDTLYTSSSLKHQWYLQASALLGATDSFHVAMGSGLYSVLVEDLNGCRVLSDDYNYRDIGIAKLKSRELKIFPNPGSSWYRVTGLETVNKGLNISLVDELGCAINLSSSLHFNQNNSIDINLESIPSGVYFLLIDSESKRYEAKIVHIK